MNQAHTGVSFNGAHNFDDWGIVLTEMVIGIPEPQTNYVDVPGLDGAIDLTTALTGDVRYEQRELEFTFQTVDRISGSTWNYLLSKIAEAIHGKEVQIILDDDRAYYYKGRATLDSYKTEHSLQTIKIVCTCDPYKYDINSPGAPWLWDPFSFVSGVIYKTTLTVDGTVTESYWNRSRRVTPTFYVTGSVSVTYGGVTYTLKEGTNVIYEISFDQNVETELTFTGNGTVNVLYEPGVL